MELEPVEQACSELESLWQQCRESVGDRISNETADSVLTWAHQFRDAFLDSCREVIDEVDRSYVVTIKYIEARCIWTKYTAKANYIAAHCDIVDGEALLRASLMSQVLVVLEKVVDQETLDSVNEFLSSTPEITSHDQDESTPALQESAS